MQQTPHHTTETSIFARPLWALTLLCCRFPKTVLFLTLLLAAASLYWSAGHLGLKMSRLDLINPDSGFNQLWLDYIAEFGDDNEVIVVVEGQNNEGVTQTLERLAQEIGKFPDVYQDVLHGIDLTAIHRKGLHYLPVDELKKIHGFVGQALQNNVPSPSGGGVGWGQTLQTGQAPTLALPHKGRGDETSAVSNMPSHDFLFPTKENTVIGFVLLRLVSLDKTQFSQGNEAIAKLRSIIDTVQNEQPNMQIGLTGMPILENDEMAMSNNAMSAATILALVGVCAIFMAGFGSLRHPLLAMVALMVAFAWTMGYITLAVGHLNILSIAFGAMLIGLGTDFSVHYLGRYLDLRRGGWDVTESLCQTAELIGPGIVTGALSTSAAFYAASLAEFTGVAELGTIAGGGVLFCAITTFTVFPALIVLITPTAPEKNAPSGSLLDIRPALAPVFVFPKITLFVFLVGFGYLLIGIPKVRYDHNLLNLQPEGLESVELEQRLLSMDVDKGGKNVWFALSIADTKEELLERKKRFAEKYPELKTEEIVSFLPEADPERIGIIRAIANMLNAMPNREPGTMSPLTATQSPALARLQSLKSMCDPNPPTENDLPLPLVSRFVGKSGKHLMRIYTTANIWDMDEMEKFVRAVRDIDPDATGSPLQTYESSLQMQEGFITAAYYAFGVVLFLTWLDFRSIGASLAALLPMFLGFAMMFGMIGLLDLPLNPANMIVLPLILGIGIDYGVHLIHDFRNRRSKHYVVSASTATSILITSLTTIIGFGSMMMASHRGLQSLGRVLVIGIVCCLVTSIIVLPALLNLWTRHEKDEPLAREKRLIRRGV